MDQYESIAGHRPLQVWNWKNILGFVSVHWTQTHILGVTCHQNQKFQHVRVIFSFFVGARHPDKFIFFVAEL